MPTDVQEIPVSDDKPQVFDAKELGNAYERRRGATKEFVILVMSLEPGQAVEWTCGSGYVTTVLNIALNRSYSQVIRNGKRYVVRNS